MGGAIGMAGGGEAVVGIEAEFVEDGLVAEACFPDGALKGGTDDSAEDAACRGGDPGIGVAMEEGGFPIGGRFRGGLHSVNAVWAINEYDSRHGSGRE